MFQRKFPAIVRDLLCEMIVSAYSTIGWTGKEGEDRVEVGIVDLSRLNARRQ